MIIALSLFLILLATITYFTSEIGWHNITEAKRNAIVFENKNQQYGAYTIRAAYNDNMLKAVGVMLLIVMAFFSGNLIWKNLFREQTMASIPPITGTICEFDPNILIPEPPAAQAKAAEPIETASVLDPLAPPEVVTTPPLENPPIQGATAPVAGSGNGGGALPGEGALGGSGGISLPAPAPPTEPAIWVDVNPSFAGGETALLNYLSKNIRYPDIEKDNGIQGTVYITFVVNANGDITDIKEMRGVRGGPNLSKEAMRVIGNMPKWNPGKMNGKPVSVRFNLPIKFMLN